MLKKTDKPYFCIEIIITRQVIPEAKVQIFCKRKENLCSIAQILLTKSNDLIKKAIKLIAHYFVRKNIDLKQTGIIDFLMLCLNENTGAEALGLLNKIQEYASSSYNSDIDLSKFSKIDQELLNEYPKIKNSIFLRFFPPSFVKYLTEEMDCKCALTIYLKNDERQPELIWTKEMRELFECTLEKHLSGFKKQLEEFLTIGSGKKQPIETMPLYNSIFGEIIKYPQVEKEIRCGEFYLRSWIETKGRVERFNPAIFYSNLETTFHSLAQDLAKVDLANLRLVLDSYTISFSKYFPIFIYLDSYPKLNKFPCIPVLLQIVLNTSQNAENTELYLGNMMKFIYIIVWAMLKIFAIDLHWRKLHPI